MRAGRQSAVTGAGVCVALVASALLGSTRHNVDHGRCRIQEHRPQRAGTAVTREVRPGLATNWPQFTLLVVVNAFGVTKAATNLAAGPLTTRHTRKSLLGLRVGG